MDGAQNVKQHNNDDQNHLINILSSFAYGTGFSIPQIVNTFNWQYPHTETEKRLIVEKSFRQCEYHRTFQSIYHDRSDHEDTSVFIYIKGG